VSLCVEVRTEDAGLVPVDDCGGRGVFVLVRMFYSVVPVEWVNFMSWCRSIRLMGLLTVGWKCKLGVQ